MLKSQRPVLSFTADFNSSPDVLILAKIKRKLGALKGVCHSFNERSEDHDKFSMPDLDNDKLSNSGSSVSRYASDLNTLIICILRYLPDF